MVEYEPLKFIDVGSVVSIYIISEIPEGRTVDDISIGRIAEIVENEGKEVEDVQVGVLEIDGGEIYADISIILSSNEVGKEVLDEIESHLDMFWSLDDIKEFIVTGNLNETRRRAEKRHNYVG